MQVRCTEAKAGGPGAAEERYQLAGRPGGTGELEAQEQTQEENDMRTIPTKPLQSLEDHAPEIALIEDIRAQGYRVWTDGEEWIVAKSQEEVRNILLEVYGDDGATEFAELYAPMEDGEELSVGFEDEFDAERSLPAGGVLTTPASGAWAYRITATTAAWVAFAVQAGAGYEQRLIASTNV
jgi:hypothetical protein